MILVDASVALKWFLSEPGAEEAKQLSLDHDLYAPDLLASEVSNGLWKAVRRGALDPAHAVAATSTLEARFAAFLPTAPLAGEALELACELDHPVYDCFYLALARGKAWPLVTSDKRLQQKLSGTPYAALCRPLESAVG